MIGIFDSGIGGLVVASELKKRLPNKKIVYFGDTARVPWGNKSEETIRRYSEEITSFLISKGVNEIVIACNTASALVADYLRRKFSNVIFHDVVDPCVQRVLEGEKGNVLIIGTKATINSRVYEKFLKKRLPNESIYSQACPLFVPFIEEGMQHDPLFFEIAKRYLFGFRTKKIKYVILGCTHYPLISNVIESVFPHNIEIIDSAKEVAKRVYEKSSYGRVRKKDDDEYYFSDFSTHHETLLGKISNSPLKIKIHRFG